MNLIEFGSISHIKKGKKPLRQVTTRENGYMPYVDIEAFETGNIKNYTDGEKCLPCKSGDILIVCDGSRSGFVGKAIDGYVGSTLAIISADGMSSDYLYYFLQGKYALLNTKKKGTGTPHLDANILNQQKLIVPDEQEQKRIVSRIEELFSELDKAEETLQKTKQQLAVYRQAVLKEAFAGKLTGSSMLQMVKLGDYIYKPRYGTSKKCDYNTTDISTPVYRIPNINHEDGIIDHADIKCAEFSGEELNELCLNVGDILMIRSNGSASLVGRCAMVRECDTKGTFAGYLIRLRVTDPTALHPNFLQYYLGSHDARIYIENKAKSTSGVHNINSNEICGLNIPLYTYENQQSIIDAIEGRLSICNNIEETVDTALAQADAMRQSILKQAFEGDL